jgi:hypothetical protein
MSALSINRLQTPARHYTLVESETAFGGRTHDFSLTGVIWGDFRPGVPAQITPSDTGAYLVQDADFICRSGVGVTRGDRLNLKNFDWQIVSLDEDADGHIRLHLERTLS